ncbi:nuclear transport factor 2 family protein [Nocardia vinacea]|uniref:Nuclear transport factor 2 family protein n=1 Tax=Nocardia vinacea TaxID=96468 RepID=A0ABZ1YT92_9NOCA|nr:nuclear transport factor 2 family protein [Nocardia vinacea]
MTITNDAGPIGHDVETYVRVRDFLARQARLLDDADAEGFAATFTGDGVLRHASRQDALRGRAAIADATRATAAAHAEATHRHWFDQIVVEPGPSADIVLVSYYALTSLVDRDGVLRFLPSCLVEDELRRNADGTLLVADRLVIRDDLDPAVRRSARR